MANLVSTCLLFGMIMTECCLFQALDKSQEWSVFSKRDFGMQEDNSDDGATDNSSDIDSQVDSTSEEDDSDRECRI